MPAMPRYRRDRDARVFPALTSSLARMPRRTPSQSTQGASFAGNPARWTEEHPITVVTEGVSDRYLAFLRSKCVSYLFGGKIRIDLPVVLRKLRAHFGVRRLLLEGGGKLDGSFLTAGVIDELSLLVAPVADGSVGTPTLFDAGGGPGPARRLKLLSVERRPGDLLWLRYRVRCD